MTTYTVACDWQHNDVFDSDEYQVSADSPEQAVAAAAVFARREAARWPGCRVRFCWVVEPEWQQNGHSPETLGGEVLERASKTWTTALANLAGCGTLT